MNHDMIQKSTRTALLLTATLILQGLRLLIPIPPQVSMFVVGALVNACLVVAVLTISWRAGVIVACVTPFFAWLEGMLPLPPFIVPVALVNTVYVLLYYVQQQWRITNGYASVVAATVCKTVVLYGSFYMLFSFVAFPDAVRHMILFAMSWPQLWTGFAGGILGIYLSRRIPTI